MTQTSKRKKFGGVRNSKVRQNAIKNGWRSGLEETLAADLKSKGIDYEYEQHVLKFEVPSRIARYTPDFYIKTKSGKTIIVESKGQFKVANRQSMILVKKQHPDIDLRFVFSRSKETISKTSKTTYAMWCEKHGFLYADLTVPEGWLNE
tara:strand:+ start:681 stop:1127 length:447 start_codon:yes stop_codon:yes gene_type:complete